MGHLRRGARAAATERAWFQKTGVYPINHTIVVKDSLLQANPHLAGDLFEAFSEAKQAFLLAGQPDDETAKIREIVGDDPLPYGIEPNRKVLEMIVQFARDQHILSAAIKPEDMFAV
jgi:4,5-dihydroxyphthalate decarboxylase